MDPPTLAEVLNKVGISQDTLDQECSDAHLVSISQFLDWRRTAPHLGLDLTEIGDIDCKRTESEKRVETLQIWKRKFGFKANFRMLVEKLLDTGNADHAEKVCRLLKQQAKVPPSFPPSSTCTPSNSASTGDALALGSRAARFDYAGEPSHSSSMTMPLSPELISASGTCSGSDHEVLVSQDQTDTASSFPYLKVGELSSQARLALQSKLLKDSDDIMSKFGDLIHHTVNSIVSSVSVRDLRIRLRSLGAYRPIHEPIPLLRNQLDEIERAEDVQRVFCILDKYYSFFNYGIIEKLIGWFGTPEDKERLETYTENFKRFCKRRTFECLPDIFGHTVDKEKTNLVVKVEESWDPTPQEGCSLENVLRLRNSLADILEVESETLYLCQIEKGCIELLFQVPSFVEEDIFPLSKEQERELTSVGVTRLTCGSYTFPQPPKALVPQISSQAESEIKQKRAGSTLCIPKLEIVEQCGGPGTAQFGYGERKICDSDSGISCYSPVQPTGSTAGAINTKIDPETGYTLVNSLQYECAYLVTEDYPPNEDKTIFKAGDRILAVGDTPTREMGPDDFNELLQSTAPKGTTVKILPRLERSPPPSLTSASLSSLDGDKKLLHRHSDQQLDSITMKVSNLLSMKASGSKRSVTLACMPADGYGFKMIGGNSVGLFVSEVQPGRKEVQVGDQILQINGQSTCAMMHYQATHLLRSQREKVTLNVMKNSAQFASICDQFEFESFYLRSQIHHFSRDHKDMRLYPGALLRVVNTVMYDDNYWLAWSVDKESGMDLELRRIPTPSRAKQQYGKDAYEQLQYPSLTQSRYYVGEAVATT